jgi:hypothetical protein
MRNRFNIIIYRSYNKDKINTNNYIWHGQCDNSRCVYYKEFERYINHFKFGIIIWKRIN